MIRKDNFRPLLKHLGFTENKNIWSKKVKSYELKVDFNGEGKLVL